MSQISSLGSRLRKAREKKGWTQTYVCQQLGISNSTLSGYERNYREPDAEMISQFSALYEISADYLLGINTKSGIGRFDDLKEWQKEILNAFEGLSKEDQKYFLGLVKKYKK